MVRYQKGIKLRLEKMTQPSAAGRDTQTILAILKSADLSERKKNKHESNRRWQTIFHVIG